MLTVKSVKVERRSSITCITSDKVQLGDVYKIPSKKNLTFKVISFETLGVVYGEIQFKVTLEFYGYYKENIKNTTDAADLINRNLVLVEDKDELSKINNSACFC